MRKPFGWDERDYLLWQQIQQLPSYGLVAGRPDNPLLARKDIERAMDLAAKQRGEKKWNAR